MLLTDILQRFEANPDAFPPELQQKIGRLQRLKSFNAQDSYRLSGIEGHLSKKEKSAAIAEAKEEIEAAETAAAALGTNDDIAAIAKLKKEAEDLIDVI